VWQQFLINGLIAGSTYGLVALGFALTYSVSRFFNFAHAAMITCAAYITLALVSGAQLPLGGAIVASITATAMMGMLTEAAIYRPLRTRQASSVLLIVASLGVYVAIQNAISLLYGDDIQTFFSGQARAGVLIFKARITLAQIVILFTNAALYTIVGLFVARTRTGKAMRAVASAPDLASIVGIDRDRVILFVFALGSGLGAVAGILVSFDTDLTPTMGFRVLLMAVVSAIVGGVGSMPGAILGGLFVGMAQHIGVWTFPTQWQDAIVFVILILFLLLRPQGFLGRPLRSTAV
jgi:branched-chain amino acid transport system permease protein